MIGFDCEVWILLNLTENDVGVIEKIALVVLLPLPKQVIFFQIYVALQEVSIISWESKSAILSSHFSCEASQAIDRHLKPIARHQAMAKTAQLRHVTYLSVSCCRAYKTCNLFNQKAS